MYFQRIYNHPPHPTLTIDEVLELLKKFQDSSVQRERDVFNCMIKSLFEEYKYFPQYPEKELHITAQLFGGIIGMLIVDPATGAMWKLDEKTFSSLPRKFSQNLNNSQSLHIALLEDVPANYRSKLVKIN